MEFIDRIANETMFYGGLAVVAASVFAAVIAGFILVIRKMKLNARFDEEYGKRDRV